MIFWRIVNDILYSISEVDKLGFSSEDPSYIPDEYLDKEIFTVCRTCLGIGDWGVISAMPRLTASSASRYIFVFLLTLTVWSILKVDRFI